MRRLVATLLGFVLLTSMAFAAPPKGDQKPLVVPEGVEARFDVEYARPDNKPQVLDLYVPKDAKGKLPLIVAIHGGGWTAGDKRGVPMVAFTRQGYAVASINYRFSQEAKFPAQIYDCKAAIRWLRAHADEFHLDADHIGVWGSSAGGHLVALLGTTGNNKELEGDEGNLQYSSQVQAVCDFFGPTDLGAMGRQSTADPKIHHDAADSPESRLIGGALPDNVDKAKAASPITYVSKNSAPFLIMHGDKDPLVPLAQSEELRDALKQSGVEVELFVVEGAGHGFPKHPELMDKVQAFFDKHLKK